VEHAHRSTLENHVHRSPRLGSRRSIIVRVGIIPPASEGRLGGRPDAKRASVSPRNDPACARVPASSRKESRIALGDVWAHSFRLTQGGKRRWGTSVNIRRCCISKTVCDIVSDPGPIMHAQCLPIAQRLLIDRATSARPHEQSAEACRFRRSHDSRSASPA
jgi:hypothetical protein